MRASILALALIAAGCGSEPPASVPPPGRFNPGLLPVSSAEVAVAESLPPQVFLHVVGGGNPCTQVGAVTQQRQGRVIDVRLETYWTAEFCIQILVQIRHTVALEGPFEPGEYVVRANGVETRFTI